MFVFSASLPDSRLILTLAELKMDLAELKTDLNEYRSGIIIVNMGGLILKNVDMMHGYNPDETAGAACLWVTNSQLTITGGKFVDCSDDTGAVGSAILYELTDESTLSKGLTISKTKFINNTASGGAAIRMTVDMPKVRQRAWDLGPGLLARPVLFF